MFLSNYGFITVYALQAITVMCDLVQGQRSRCPSTDPGVGTILSIGKRTRTTGIGLPAMSDFNFRDLEKSSKVKAHDAL